MAYVTKTIRNRIENRPGLQDWYDATRSIYNQVVAFYFDLYQAHPGLLDIGQGQALTLAEKLTHKTESGPHYPAHNSNAGDVAAGSNQCRSWGLPVLLVQPQRLAKEKG